jgi:hypothetical protein
MNKHRLHLSFLPARTAGARIRVFRAVRSPGDTVLDIFAGSNTTGRAAAGSMCHLESAIPNRAKRGASACRFVDELPAGDLAALWSRLHSDDLPLEVNQQQGELVLMERRAAAGLNRPLRGGEPESF